MLTTTHKFPDAVNSIAYSPDGTMMAVGTNGSVITLFERKVERELQMQTRGIRCLSFSPDSTRLVSGGYDTQVRIWSLQTFKDTILYGHSKAVHSVVYSHDSQTVASGDSSGVIKIWGHNAKTLVGFANIVKGLGFSKDDMKLVGGCLCGAIRVWDLRTGATLLAWSHGNEGLSTLISDGEIVISGSKDTTVKVWDIDTGKELGVLQNAPVKSVALSSRDEIAVGCEDATCRIWYLPAGACREILTSMGGEVYAVVWSPSGQDLAIGTSSGELHIYDEDAEPIVGKAVV